MRTGIDPALDNLLEKWLDWIAHGKRLSPHTVRAYRTDIDDFLRFTNTHTGRIVTLALLAELALADFRAWIAAKALDQVTARSRARAVSSLRHFYKWLDREGILHNPAVQLLRSPKLPRTLPRPLSVPNAEHVLDTAAALQEDWAGTRDKALFTLLYGAGLRIDEALRLNCGDWPSRTTRDTANDHLTITGKGNKQRQIVLLDIVHDAMALYLRQCPFPQAPERPLFLGKHGKRLHQGVAQRAMRQIRVAMNLPDTVTPHALRHSFATHLLVDGVNIRAIQELLGHASLSTTQRYTELDIEDMRSIIERMHPRGSLAPESEPDSHTE